MNKKEVRFPVAAIFLLLIVLVKLVLRVPHFARFTGIHMVMNARVFLTAILPLLVLAGVLLIKDRGFMLVGALGFSAAVELLNVFSAISVVSAGCAFLAFLLLIVLALCGPENAKLKIPAIRKLWFLPGVLQCVPMCIYLAKNGRNLLNVLRYIFRNVRFPLVALGYIMQFLPYLLMVVAVIALGRWLVCGEKKAYADLSADETAADYDGDRAYAVSSQCFAYCGLIKHILLLSFTFGIWYLIWICRTTKYLNRAPGSKQYSPVAQLLLCLFIPFYQIYWYYKQGERITALSQERGVVGESVTSFCLFCGIFMPVAACIVMQDRINTLCINSGEL